MTCAWCGEGQVHYRVDGVSVCYPCGRDAERAGQEVERL